MSRVRGAKSLLRQWWDKATTTRTGENAVFVGRVAGEDAGYVGETGAEARRTAGAEAGRAAGAEAGRAEESPAERPEELR